MEVAVVCLGLVAVFVLGVVLRLAKLAVFGAALAIGVVWWLLQS